MESFSSSDDPFNELVKSFTEQISLLKHLCMMRSTDSLDAWQNTLRDLDARLTQIERSKADLRTTANRELRFVGQAHELVELLKQQQEHTLQIEAHMPPELLQPKPKPQPHQPQPQPVPKQNSESMPPPPAAVASASAGKGRETVTAQPARKSTGTALKKSGGALDGSVGGNSAVDTGAGAGRRKKKGFCIPALVPVSKEELDGCPSYIRGRVTVPKVNAAIDEIMSVVQEKYRILSLSPTKMGAATRNKYQMFLEQQKEAGDLVFFTEDDIKASQHVKFDATGKAVLATLQALGRLKIDGGRQKKYVLLGC